MPYDEIFNGRMPAAPKSEAERFMQNIELGKIKLIYNIERQQFSEQTKQENFNQLLKERNKFLQQQGRNDVINGRKVPIPKMEDNGNFLYENGGVLKDNGQILDAKWFLRQTIEKITKTESGKELLKTINDDLAKQQPALYSQNMKELFEKDDEERRRYTEYKDAFIASETSVGQPLTITFTNKNPLSVKSSNGVHNNINLNIWNNSIGVAKQGSLFPEIYHIHNIGKSRSKIGNEDFVEVGEGLSPFYLPFAHELIHIKHRIDGSNRIEKPIQQTRCRTSIEEQERTDCGLRGTTWVNKEEQHTVTDVGDISENSIRAEAGEPIRLNYTEAKNYHESLIDILESANASENHYGSQKIQKAINTLPQKQIPKNYYNTDNSKYIRFKSLHKILQQSYDNKNIFGAFLNFVTKNSCNPNCKQKWSQKYENHRNTSILNGMSKLFTKEQQQKISNNKNEYKGLLDKELFRKVVEQKDQNSDL